MTRPHLYLIRMAAFLVVVALIVVFLIGTLLEAFRANPALNGLILGVLLLGILYIFRQVQLLYAEVDWIGGFRSNLPGASVRPPPRMLAPMASMVGERQGQLRLSPSSMRSLLSFTQSPPKLAPACWPIKAARPLLAWSSTTPRIPSAASR